VRIQAQDGIAVPTGHHEHGLDPTHGRAHQADPAGVDFRALGQQMVCARNIFQIVA
jgi:hypothetical protein